MIERSTSAAARWLYAAVCLGLVLGASGASVSMVNPTNAPNDGSATVTVYGTQLGPVRQFFRLRVGGTACSGHTWLSETSVSATLPPSGVQDNPRVVLTLQTMSIKTLSQAWTYDSHIVSAVTPQTAAPDALGSVMTVLGQGFGSYECSQRVRLGDSAAVSTTWVSSSSVLAKIPDGAHFLNGKSASVVLSVIASGGNPRNRKTLLSNAFTYALPVITDIHAGGSPANTPAMGGSMTVSGRSFGSSDYSLDISVGSSRVASCKWTSDTSVVAVVAPGVGDSLDARIGIDRYNPPQVEGGSLTQLFFYDLPVVTGASVRNGPATGGLTVLVYGVNFGGADYTQAVDINGIQCSQSRWTSDSTLSCETPAAFGHGKAIGVDVQGRIASTSEAFSYDAPSVTRLSQGNGPSDGVSTLNLIVEGSNFGTTSSGAITGTLVARVYSEFGGGECRPSLWTSDSSVQCGNPIVGYNPPPGVGQKSDVSVDLFGQEGILTECYSYDLPVIGRAGAYLGWPYPQSIHNLPAGETSELSIVGRNFGTNDFSAKARVGGTACITTVWQSDSALLCQVVGGHSRANSVVVSVARDIASLLDCVTFDAPFIESMTPPNAPAGGGVPVTLSGKSFGSQQYSQSASIGDTSITVAWTSDSSMVGIVPPGRGLILDVAVHQYPAATVAPGALSTAQSTVKPEHFTYDDPSIIGINPPNGPTAGNFEIVLSGASFSDAANPAQNQPRVTVGQTPCTSALWRSDKEIRCTVAAGIGAASVSLDLQIQGCTGNNGACIAASPISFFYDGPHPSAIEGVGVFPSTGGGILTVTGTLFGASAYASLLKAKIGPTDCSTSTWLSETSLTCVVPEGVGTRDVVVDLAGSANTLSDAFSYESPTVTDVAPLNGPGSGGVSMIVLGDKFGHSAALDAPTIAVGGREVISPALASSTKMVCESPPGFRVPGRGLEMTYRSFGAPRDQAQSLSSRFLYDDPQLTQVTPFVVSGISGGSSLTVLGKNFGGVDSSPVVFLGSLDPEKGQAPVACSVTAWLSDSSIQCVSPRTGSGSRDVHFLAAGAIGKRSLAALKDTLADDGGDRALGGTFALTLTKGVSFVNVPANLSTGSYDIDCGAGTVDWSAGDELEGVSFALGPGFCDSNDVPSALVYTLKFGSTISRDNSIMPVSVIVGLQLLGLEDTTGYISVSFPVTLDNLSRRRLLQTAPAQAGGYFLRSAYLDQCEGTWIPLCSIDEYNSATRKLSSQVPAEVLKDECSGGLVEPRRCADQVAEDYFCGGGILLSAFAYKKDPCLAPTGIGLLPIILGSVGGFLLLILCSFLAIRQLRLNREADERAGLDDDVSRSSYEDSVDKSDLYDSRASYGRYDGSPGLNPGSVQLSRRSPSEYDYSEMPAPYTQFSYPNSRAYAPPDGSPDFFYGGAPNSNFMGPMGGGYGLQGGTMNQYGRPLTPTGGGFQLGIMPGMGAPMYGQGMGPPWQQPQQPQPGQYNDPRYGQDPYLQGEMSYMARRL